MKRLLKPQSWIIIIFVAGLLYIFALQSLLVSGVYFTGDSGLRAVISRNLASGYMAFDLNLSHSPWVQALWDAGLFPFEEPFVYQLNGKSFITFPYTFSLVTAPFYAAFGYHGLYVIPWLSTIIIWFLYAYLARKLAFSPAATAIGLFFLIFATHLTLYSAIYWEHTLSVCLAFAGLACIFPHPGNSEVRPWAIAASGLLTSLAVWFRPEQIFLVIFLALLALYSMVKASWGWPTWKWLDIGKLPGAIGKKGWIYLAASLFTLLAYGLTNWLIYKNFFGVHAIQVLEPKPLVDRLDTIVDNFRLLTVESLSIFLYVPITIFLAGYLLFAVVWQDRVKFKRDWIVWYGFCVMFLVGVSVLVPAGAGGKQCGPRFLLLLAPVMTLLFTEQIDQVLNKNLPLGSVIHWGSLVVVILVGAIGVLQNPIRGSQYLVDNYAQVKPVVEDLRANAKPVIIVSDPYLAQNFLPALKPETFILWVDTDLNLALVGKTLLEQNQDTFTYICYTIDCEQFDPDETVRRIARDDIWYSVETLSAREYGKYILIDLRVARVE